MQACIEDMETLNPGSMNTSILGYNLPILIERKLKHFPEINKLIASAQISIVDGKECLTVVSTDFGGADR